MSSLPADPDSSRPLTLRTPKVYARLAAALLDDPGGKRELAKFAAAAGGWAAGGARPGPRREPAERTREGILATMRGIFEVLKVDNPQTKRWLGTVGARVARAAGLRLPNDREGVAAILQTVLEVETVLVVGLILPACAYDRCGQDAGEAVRLVQLAGKRAWGWNVEQHPYYGPLLFRCSAIVSHGALQPVMDATLRALGLGGQRADELWKASDSATGEAFGAAVGTFWERLTAEPRALEDHVVAVREQARADRAHRAGAPEKLAKSYQTEVRAAQRKAEAGPTVRGQRGAQDLTAATESAQATAAKAEEVERRKAALAELDPLVQDVLRLTKVEGMTQDEAAEALGVSQPTVSRAYAKGMQALEDLRKPYD